MMLLDVITQNRVFDLLNLLATLNEAEGVATGRQQYS